jgi:cadmium resistance protein CadD (predicted permease)
VGALSLALIAIGVFATTNVDDLFVLASFFSDKQSAHWQVVAGQVVGIGTLIAVSCAAALIAFVVSPAYVGLLGIVPLFLGLAKLRSLRFSSSSDVELEDKSAAGANFKVTGISGVAAVTIASGGDNIGIYAPLFASQTQAEAAETIAIFAALTLVWCLVARLVVSHPAVEARMRRIGPILMPMVLIALSVWILYRSGAVEFLAQLASQVPT